MTAIHLINQLTPAWLTEQLRACGVLPDGAVTAVHPLHLNTTPVSNLYRIAVDYDQDSPGVQPPRYLFLKLANTAFTT